MYYEYSSSLRQEMCSTICQNFRRHTRFSFCGKNISIATKYFNCDKMFQLLQNISIATNYFNCKQLKLLWLQPKICISIETWFTLALNDARVAISFENCFNCNIFTEEGKWSVAFKVYSTSRHADVAHTLRNWSVLPSFLGYQRHVGT